MTNLSQEGFDRAELRRRHQIALVDQQKVRKLHLSRFRREATGTQAGSQTSALGPSGSRQDGKPSKFNLESISGCRRQDAAEGVAGGGPERERLRTDLIAEEVCDGALVAFGRLPSTVDKCVHR